MREIDPSLGELTQKLVDAQQDGIRMIEHDTPNIMVATQARSFFKARGYTIKEVPHLPCRVVISIPTQEERSKAYRAQFITVPFASLEERVKLASAAEVTPRPAPVRTPRRRPEAAPLPPATFDPANEQIRETVLA
jgi:hypothetical protein